jgi:hypothetical protein
MHIYHLCTYAYKKGSNAYLTGKIEGGGENRSDMK